LLTIFNLYDDAYCVAVLEEMEWRMNRTMSIGSVHRTMQRLEEKGLVNSYFREATIERGGRRKRLISLTLAGEKSLIEATNLHNKLWSSISKAALEQVSHDFK
jgi:DNA-binding MarR family transcriptional regulator